MTKPDWCTQEVWDEAGEKVLWSDEVFGKVSLTFEESDILHFCIARTLLDAYQRGRREGMEEAAKIIEDHHTISDGKPLDFTVPEIIRAIRTNAKGETK